MRKTIMAGTAILLALAAGCEKKAPPPPAETGWLGNNVEGFTADVQLQDEKGEKVRVLTLQGEGAVVRLQIAGDKSDTGNPIPDIPAKPGETASKAAPEHDASKETVVAVIDRGKRVATMWTEGETVAADNKMAVSLAWDIVEEQMRGLKEDATAVKAGSSTVAGLGCTEWDVTPKTKASDTAAASDNKPFRVCSTKDGVPLRIVDPASGTAWYEVTKLVRGPQPATAFAPPEGYKTIDLVGLSRMAKMFADKSEKMTPEQRDAATKALEEAVTGKLTQ